MPAFAAGLFGLTPVMTMPSSLLELMSLCTPKYPRITRPSRIIFCKTSFAISIGMAKFSPSAISLAVFPILRVLIPTNSPAELINAPPELPRLIEASV